MEEMLSARSRRPSPSQSMVASPAARLPDQEIGCWAISPGAIRLFTIFPPASYANCQAVVAAVLAVSVSVTPRS